MFEKTGWYVDDGNCEMYYDWASSGEEAAQEYVDSGEWGEINKTTWFSLRAWQVDEEGEIVNDNVHAIELIPEEPECSDSEHDWQSPVSIVGGLWENPGVWGHGGGAFIKEVCMSCGCGKTTDTWAQDPETGQQGLTSIEYCRNEYLTELEEYYDHNQ